MSEENNPAPRGLSDQQAVDVMLGVDPESKKAPEGQADKQSDVSEADTKKPQAIGNNPEAPPVESDEQAVDSLMEEEGDEADDEQDAVDGDELDTDESDDEHSEESDEEVEAREVSPNDVIFHDPEGNPVTAEEAHRGYLRQSDYTKKTQQLSEEREHVQRAYAQREQERQVLAENINMALNVIEPTIAELKDVNWDKLASEDPHTYARTKAMYEQASERYQQLQQMGQEAIQQAEQEQAQKRAQHLQVQAKLAERLIPELADPKKAPQTKARLRAYLEKAAGFKPEEVGRVATDARILNLVNKALQYDLSRSQSRKVKSKKVDNAPRKGLKPGAPKSQAQRLEQQRKDKMGRLRRSGRLEDGIDLILE